MTINTTVISDSKPKYREAEEDNEDNYVSRLATCGSGVHASHLLSSGETHIPLYVLLLNNYNVVFNISNIIKLIKRN